jgi:hypothetical protein
MSNLHFSELTKPDILGALARLDELLGTEGMTGELCLFGGTVMVLVFNARISTRDVDAVFQPASLIRNLAAQIAQEQKLPESWLNDGVKGFQSDKPEVTVDDLPQYAHLRVYRATAEYLLAMKCMASRAGDATHRADRADIVALVRHLNLSTVDEVLAVVERFFPANRILPKTQFMIQEVISSFAKGK